MLIPAILMVTPELATKPQLDITPICPAKALARTLALPPLGTPEYVAYIRKADPKELPPQVLARAFRQLPPNSEAANVTLTRLIGEHDQTGYLGTVWSLAE